ncbi:MAG: response regulator [Patescibacteria group bacterium]
MRVLLVDSEPDCQQFLKRWFKTKFNNINLEICEYATECWQKLQTGNPDLIITAICLKEIDGLEMIRLIRKQKNNTPIIIFSATSINQETKNELDELKTHFVQKPNIEELREKIKILIPTPTY